MLFSRLIGTGSYLPQSVYSNERLASEYQLDTSDTWIRERTGIASRYFASENEDVLSMGLAAAKVALEAAEISAEEIDLIIVATCSYEKVFPSAACGIQAGLDIRRPVIAFDLQAACTGFVYALSVADQFIRQGKVRHALVLGSETMSRVIDFKDRSTCVLFGDGAAAVVLRADTKPGILSTDLSANGSGADLLQLDKNGHLKMQGNKVFRFGVTHLDTALRACLNVNGLSIESIDWLVPHQANIRMIQAMAENLNLPLSKVVTTLETQGNTSAASVPLALDWAIRQGKIKTGQHVLLEAIGGGLTWGTALLRY